MPSLTSKVNVAREQWDRLGRYRQRYEIEDRLDPVISLQRSIDRRKGRLAALIRHPQFARKAVIDADKSADLVRPQIALESVLDRNPGLQLPV